MKTRERLWKLMAAMAMVLCIAACADDDSDGNGKNNNTVPVSAADWQTVPATGGTIEKDDIAITFPSGTFTSDTKVAITNVKKGKMGGDKEASPFYQITMPLTTAKPVTVRMKSAESGDDIGYVISTRAWVTSAQEEVYHESFLETSYEDGEYLTTIPALNNGEDTENESFIIGLGHLPQLEDTETKSPTRASSWKNSPILSGSEDGVKWEIYIGWKAWWNFDRETLRKADRWKYQIGREIEEAIKQIHKLGFKLNGKGRTIPFYYEYYDPEKDDAPWGEFQQDYMNNDWWSCIFFDTRQIASVDITEPLKIELKHAIIHETFHYYQSDYDPRHWSARKTFPSLLFGEDENLTLCEMGSVWIEKFRNNGKLNGNYQLKEHGLCNCFENHFRLGVPRTKKDILELFPKKKNNEYQQQGYALAPLLEYMLKKEKREDSSVYDLFKDWKNESSTSMIGANLNTPMPWRLFNWCNSWFYNVENFDGYYTSLFMGEIMEEFSIKERELYEPKGKAISKVMSKLGEDSMKGKVYPNGCEAMYVCIKNIPDTLLAKYEFVVKQKEKGVHTQLLYSDTQTIKKASGKAMGNDSIVISGETLKAFIENNAPSKKLVYLFLLTTRDENSATAEGTIPTNTWFELREARKATTKFKMTKVTELNFSTSVYTEDKSTGTKLRVSEYLRQFDDCKITQNGSTVHLEFTKSYNEGYSSSKKLSFDIVNFTKEAYDDQYYGPVTTIVKNLIYTNSERWDYSSSGVAEYKTKDCRCEIGTMYHDPYTNQIGYYNFSCLKFTHAGNNYWTLDKFVYNETNKDWGKPAREHNYTVVENSESSIGLKLSYEYTSE